MERGEHTQLIKLLVYFERLYVFLKNTCFKTNQIHVATTMNIDRDYMLRNHTT